MVPIGNYTQWRAAVDRKEIRRVTWVCGDQPVLVEEVVDTIRGLLRPSELDCQTFTGGTDPDREIWAAARQYPLVPGAPRLVVVRSAEKVTRWEPLGDWMDDSRLLPGAHLVFVSAEPDLAARTVKGKKLGPAEHIEMIQGRRNGHIVRCSMPNETDLLAWVKRRARLDDEMARYLLTRSGGDLLSIAGVCAKLTLFEGMAGPATITALCNESPAGSFVDLLLLCKKPAAFAALNAMGESDYGWAINQLDGKLDLLAALWRAARAGYSPREIQGIPPFLVHKYLSAAKHYDPQRCVYRRRALAVVDDAYRNGARAGVLEALTALW